VFWVISAYCNIRNTLPKSDTFLLGHYMFVYFVIFSDLFRLKFQIFVDRCKLMESVTPSGCFDKDVVKHSN
jgi:hypothetical protein